MNPLLRTSIAVVALGLPTLVVADEARNLETIQAFYDALDSDTVTSTELASFFSPDFEDHNRPPMMPAEMTDFESHIAILTNVTTGFSDETHQIQVMETLRDGSVLVAWDFVGTHSGDFFGVPASGRQVFMTGFDIYTLDEEGHIVAQRHVEDVAGLMAQITAP